MDFQVTIPRRHQRPFAVAVAVRRSPLSFTWMLGVSCWLLSVRRWCLFFHLPRYWVKNPFYCVGLSCSTHQIRTNVFVSPVML